MPGAGQLAEELCDALAVFEPDEYSVDRCGVLAEVFARAAKACEAAAARTAARAHGPEASEHLARASGSTVGRARAALDTVRDVERCPTAKDALVDGTLSLEQAGAIARLPDQEAELVQLAQRSSVRAIRDEVRRREVAAVHPDRLYEARRAAREFHHWVDRLGMVCFRGALPPDVGIPFVNRLDRLTDREWRVARKDKRLESRSAHAADAFAQLVRGRGASAQGGTDLVLVYDLEAWTRGHAHTGEVGHVVGGGTLPVSVARRLAVDAFVKVVLHDGTKVDTIIHYGRRRPALLQSVLDLGDPPVFEGVTCSEEGCDRRYGLQWDHVVPVADGGPTCADNLQPMCSPDHAKKTERERRERAP